MAGLMDALNNPDLWQYIGGVGSAMNRSAAGEPFDLSRANAGLAQSVYDKRMRSQINGLMQNGGYDPQQQEVLRAYAQFAPQEALGFMAQQAFPEPGAQTDFTRMLDALSPEQRQQALLIKAGLAPSANRPSTNVNVNSGGGGFSIGTIPQGYMVRPTEGGWAMVPVPGGPEARKIEAENAAAVKRADQANTAADTVQDAIGDARNIVDKSWFPTTGLISNWIGGIPIIGQDKYNLDQVVQTIKANIGFDRLQQMREGSPTGGALGAVSEKEMGYLQSVMGSLDTAQDRAQFLRNLGRVEQIYKNIVKKLSAYPNAAQYGFASPQPVVSPEVESALREYQ